MDHRLQLLNLSPAHTVHIRVFAAIAHNHHSRHIVPFLLQLLQIKFHQKIPRFYTAPLIDARLKQTAVQTNGFQTDMDHQLRSTIGDHADCMPGAENQIYDSIRRRNDSASLWNQRNPFSNHFLAEYRIIHFRHGNQSAFDRS